MNLSWLKKTGQEVLKIVGVAIGLLPLLSEDPEISNSPTATSTVDKLEQAMNAVITAEQMFAAASGPNAQTGSQKLAAATPFVATLVQDVLSGLPGSPRVKDSAAFAKACSEITGGLADALNACGD